MDKIPVFFTPKMVAESGCESPSASKPPKVVASWQEKFPIDVLVPPRVTIDDYALAHDREWVERVLSCQADNGFGNRSKAVAESLPYTSGAMLQAARLAITTGAVAVAPCSGFHHAGHHTAQGFCTFNGLMVAALALKADGIKRVGILDLDMHYGNGTAEIIRMFGHGSFITHFTAGLEWTQRNQAEEFLTSKLASVLDSMIGCDVVLYQAGADAHVDDPYGGWMTTDQLRRRDAIVFDVLRREGVPVAWNLAGGYQVEEDGSIPKVLEIHDNTMYECVRRHVEGERCKAGVGD